MERHGLKTASAHKKQRLMAAAEEEAHEAMALAATRAKIGETKINPDDLRGERGGLGFRLLGFRAAKGG